MEKETIVLLFIVASIIAGFHRMHFYLEYEQDYYVPKDKRKEYNYSISVGIVFGFVGFWYVVSLLSHLLAY